jgi:hypothetical protein
MAGNYALLGGRLGAVKAAGGDGRLEADLVDCLARLGTA